MPSGLQYLRVKNNQLSGPVPPFPSTLTNLMLGSPGSVGNFFSGSIWLNQPIYVEINNNYISDIVIIDTSQLSTCDLSNNPMIGNPHISGLTMCSKNNLYSITLPISTVTLTASTTSLENYQVSTTMQDISTIIFVSNSSIANTVCSLTTKQLEMILPFTSPYILLVIMLQVLRITINTVLLVFTIHKTPFSRELRVRMKKRKTPTAESFN